MISQRINKGIGSLQAYQPGRPISEVKRLYGVTELVKLASNENAYGPSAKVLQALEVHSEDLLRYPDGNGYHLKKVLSAFHDVSPAQITLGNGSNDVLDLVARVFLREGRSAMFSQYAFAVYPISSQSMGADLQVVPASDFGYDLESCLESVNDSTSVIFIANPNNPTGTFNSAEKILNFLQRIPQTVIVVLDEAYIEYLVGDNCYDSVPWLNEFPNLIITRTFSKAYGLAGLRVGYAISSSEVADVLNRVRQPFNVNTLALNAAVAALGDQSWLDKTMRQFQIDKAEFEKRLTALAIHWIPSQANFLCVHFPNQAGMIARKLLEKGVIVRDLEGYRLPHHLRISIGTSKENEVFFNMLERLL